jgi:hypothetical protein
MRFDVKVCDSLHNVMFIAQVSDIYVTAFSPSIKPFMSGIVAVEPGTGNCGDKLEYSAKYSGSCMKYADFVALMDNIDI